MVLTGIFREDTNPTLHLSYADDGTSPEVEDVVLFINEIAYPLQKSGTDYTHGTLFLQASDNIRVECKKDDYTAKAWTRVPPNIAFTSVSSNSITINPSSTGAPAMVVQWTPLNEDEYSYVIHLEPLDINATVIPFDVPAGRFNAQYSGPITQTGTIIFDTDFKYYGPHRLTVYAIRKDFEEMYFYDLTDLRGLALLSPDNIQNAKGFVTAISTTSIEFNIQ
jgi:hypothetical protein